MVSKGTLDTAYLTLNLASTGVALNCEVAIFFTFFGVDIVHKEKNNMLQISTLNNPALPSPIVIPNIVGILPGMTPIYTAMYNNMIKKTNQPSIPELVSICIHSGVKMIACTPTLEMTGVTKDDLVDGVELAGAAKFMDYALDSDLNLLI